MGGATDPRAAVRGARNAGYVACLVGVLVMVSGRYMAGAPHWLMFVGLAGIILGWGLMAYSVFARAAAGRSQSFDRSH
jgi:hypothetical protein